MKHRNYLKIFFLYLNSLSRRRLEFELADQKVEKEHEGGRQKRIKVIYNYLESNYDPRNRSISSNISSQNFNCTSPNLFWIRLEKDIKNSEIVLLSTLNLKESKSNFRSTVVDASSSQYSNCMDIKSGGILLLTCFNSFLRGTF